MDCLTNCFFNYFFCEDLTAIQDEDLTTISYHSDSDSEVPDGIQIIEDKIQNFAGNFFDTLAGIYFENASSISNTVEQAFKFTGRSSNEAVEGIGHIFTIPNEVLNQTF